MSHLLPQLQALWRDANVKLVAGSALLVIVSILVAIWPRKASNLPPGPAPEFFVGNRNQVPKGGKPWLWFKELNEEYGPVVYLRRAGTLWLGEGEELTPLFNQNGKFREGKTPTIILGTAQAAWDLLEKRSNIYSSRPRFIMGQEILSNNMRGLMSPYNDFWRRWRKVLHGAFMQKASDTYRPIQSLESKQLMHELLHRPQDWSESFERYAASVVVTVTYGRRVHNVKTDHVVNENRQSMHYLTGVNIPGKFLVESLPALLYLPSFLTPWRSAALEQRKRDIAFYVPLVQEVQAKMDRGVAPVSFCRQLLEMREKTGMTELEIAYTCGTPFGAGVDTSSGTLMSFMLACAAFGPTFIAKAQAELDSVVGSDRLPTFEDQEDLAYVRAVVSETLRWRPIAVLGGTPHASTEDDVYNGMFIPKGSTLIANLWSIHLNDDDFPDPHTFDPERFMVMREYPGQWGHSSFGFGRRICPGMHLGNNSVFINIARILWGFNISKALDAEGKEIDVDILAFTDGFNSMPEPFEVSIKPRSAAHAAVIEREWEGAAEDLKAYEY